MPKPQVKPERVDDRRKAWMLAAILFAATLISYIDVVHHDFVSFDDPLYVSQYDHVRTGLSMANIGWAFTAFHAFNWHPLTWISHMLDVSLFGVDAGRLALMNVLIHALSSVLLLFLIRKKTRKIARFRAAAGLRPNSPELHVYTLVCASRNRLSDAIAEGEGGGGDRSRPRGRTAHERRAHRAEPEQHRPI